MERQFKILLKLKLNFSFICTFSTSTTLFKRNLRFVIVCNIRF